MIHLAPVPDRAYTLVHGYFTAFPPFVFDPEAEDTLEEQLEALDVPVPSPYSEALVLYVARAIALMSTDRQRYELADEALRSLNSRLADNRRRQQGTGRIKTRDDY